jgi:CrcB protein
MMTLDITRPVQTGPCRVGAEHGDLFNPSAEIIASMGTYIWIAIGSALGGVARYWCSGVAARLIGETFPWGTLIVNVIGSFIIGFFSTLTGPEGRVYAGTTVRQFVMVGFCGGYTTFSSFSLQTLSLLNDGEMFRAGANIGLSVLCCMLAVWAGHLLALSFNSMKWV